MDTELLDLLGNFNYRSISEIYSVQTCDFSTLYKRLWNDKNRYKLIVIGHEISYFILSGKVEHLADHKFSSHHWILCLTRSMMTFLLYNEYQNCTRIHIEEIILQVLILFEESIFFINMSNILTAVKEGTKSIHVVVSITCEYWNIGSSR